MADELAKRQYSDGIRQSSMLEQFPQASWAYVFLVAKRFARLHRHRVTIALSDDDSQLTATLLQVRQLTLVTEPMNTAVKRSYISEYMS